MKILKKTIQLVCVSFALLLSIPDMHSQSYIDKGDAFNVIKEYTVSEANRIAKNVHEPLTIGVVNANSGLQSPSVTPPPNQDLLDFHIYLDVALVDVFFKLLQESTDVSDAVNSYESLHIAPLVNHANSNTPKYSYYINKETQFLNGVKKLFGNIISYPNFKNLI